MHIPIHIYNFPEADKKEFVLRTADLRVIDEIFTIDFQNHIRTHNAQTGITKKLIKNLMQ